MDPEDAEPVCRYCFEDGSKESLISPCAGCRGSIAFIHLTCLTEYFRAQEKWTDLRCPTCKHKYNAETTVKLAEEGLRKTEERGKETPEYVEALELLLNSYVKNKNFSKAAKVAPAALALAERVFGPDWANDQGHQLSLV